MQLLVLCLLLLNLLEIFFKLVEEHRDVKISGHMQGVFWLEVLIFRQPDAMKNLVSSCLQGERHGLQDSFVGARKVVDKDFCK